MKKILVTLVLLALVAVLISRIDYDNISKTVSKGLISMSNQSSNQTATDTQESKIYFYDNTQSSQDYELFQSSAETPYNSLQVEISKTDHWYGEMNDEQKIYYEIILAAFEDMPIDFIKVTNKDDDFKNNINIAYNGVLNDHPEIFWQDNTYEVMIKNDSECFIKLGYCFDKQTRDDKRTALNTAVSDILSKAPTEDDFAKELFFYEYVCSGTAYNNNEDNMKYTAFGALINGNAVCEGYAKAFQLLCHSADINCLLVRGEANGITHVWNLVELAGNWYELDATWSDNESGTPNYLYFNATTDEMSTTHTRFADITEKDLTDVDTLDYYNLGLPECTETLYSRDALTSYRP